MPVAKATAITQVTDPSCELRPVIGPSTGVGGVYTLSVLIGWLVLAEAGAPADRDSVGSIDLIGWQAGRQ